MQIFWLYNSPSPANLYQNRWTTHPHPHPLQNSNYTLPATTFRKLLSQKERSKIRRAKPLGKKQSWIQNLMTFLISKRRAASMPSIRNIKRRLLRGSNFSKSQIKNKQFSWRDCHNWKLKCLWIKILDSRKGHLGCWHCVVRSCTLSCFNSYPRLKLTLTIIAMNKEMAVVRIKRLVAKDIYK